MIYAIDFDGTLCTNAWPDIGKPRTVLIDHFRGLKEMLALLKTGRIASGQTKADNYIDLAGYAACAGEIALKE